jgi:cell division protein ZapE
MSFRAHLDELLSSRGYALDAAQRAAADRLARLDEAWAQYRHARRNALLKLVARPEIPRGVYLWGSVGRPRPATDGASVPAAH